MKSGLRSLSQSLTAQLLRKMGLHNCTMGTEERRLCTKPGPDTIPSAQRPPPPAGWAQGAAGADGQTAAKTGEGICPR